MGRTLLKVLLVFAGMSVSFSFSEARAVGLFQHYSIMVNPEDTSYGCLSCHDGTIASSVGICTVDCTVSDSHPVEKEYPPLGREAKFASIDNVVAAGIKLLDNKIGCISCHDITNQSESHLRIPNENSGLCTVCHIQ